MTPPCRPVPLLAPGRPWPEPPLARPSPAWRMSCGPGTWPRAWPPALHVLPCRVGDRPARPGPRGPRGSVQEGTDPCGGETKHRPPRPLPEPVPGRLRGAPSPGRGAGGAGEPWRVGGRDPRTLPKGPSQAASPGSAGSVDRAWVWQGPPAPRFFPPAEIGRRKGSSPCAVAVAPRPARGVFNQGPW